MRVETVLLVLESVLLIFTIVLLLFNIKEGRGREKLLREVSRATKTLTRVEYFLTVSEALAEAKTEVVGLTTGRMPGPEDWNRTRDIAERIKKITASGIKVKYLLPHFHDRLYIGHLYTKAGAEVRYSTCAIPFDIRYMVVDDRVLIIGVPESTGEKEATRKGYRIPSEGLASLFKEHFYNCWDRAIDFRAYMRDVIREAGVLPGQLAQELHIEPGELEHFYKA